jgi:aspartyl-tRNA(Asn)/glutamyl-tRNA(Gln) amidotransferase subunit C
MEGVFMSVTKKDVETVAELARLKFDESEKERMTETLNNILGYFDKLSELDTSEVEPLTHILPVENVMREDVVQPSLDQDTALANAPKHARGHFIIPRVIE